ncbi:hypothetical protein [Moraxella canis]|uniref:hypothetical protein n=1 Tax=Moraxella canis TaxID=90239 RepID=UPI00069D64FB|nr:hypothetical protein [Moraxella canis]
MKENNLLEVWGDTVDAQHLLISIIIGAMVSSGIFLIAKTMLGSLDGDIKLLNGYAMLLGIAGCLLSGLICALLFKPKRVIVAQQSIDTSGQKIQEVLGSEMAKDKNYQYVDQLPEKTRQELKLLGLYETLKHAEQAQRTKSG